MIAAHLSRRLRSNDCSASLNRLTADVESEAFKADVESEAFKRISIAGSQMFGADVESEAFKRISIAGLEMDCHSGDG